MIPNSAEQQAEQPVVARHRRVDLLRGGDLLDRGRFGGGVVGVVDLLHDLADAVGRGVGHAQPHDLLGLARDLLDLLQGGGQDPDQARGRLRVEVLVGGVGEADHGDRGGVAVDADDLDLVPTRRCAAAANEASTTAPGASAGLSPARSQLPSVTSGADMAGSVGRMARSSTGDSVAPCSRVAEAMIDGVPTL